MMKCNPYEIVPSGNGTIRIRVTGSCAIFDDYLVPIGYECDGASIPRWLWWLCGEPLDEPRIIAAIVHDWLYDCRVYDRIFADRIYRNLLIELGVPRWKADTEFAAVRAFGWIHWVCNATESE